MTEDLAWLKPASLLAALSVGCAILVQSIADFASYPSGITSLSIALMVVAVSATFRLLVAVFTLWRAGAPDPIRQLRIGARSALREQAVIVAAVVLVGLLLYSTNFLKSMITAVVPFWADEPLAALDAAIGIDGEAIARTLGSALPVVGFYYGLWHIVNLGGILWVIHWRGPGRGHFILSFMLTWGIGMAMAYAFSSAGPLFTGAYAMSVAPTSVQIPAQFLWTNYQANGAQLGGGISAFPSLHVAIATWFAAVLAYRGWPKLGFLYAASIYFGSVALGWHYAADGAGGIAIALLADQLGRRLSCHRPHAPAAKSTVGPARDPA